jgi:hypothetical protein
LALGRRLEGIPAVSIESINGAFLKMAALHAALAIGTEDYDLTSAEAFKLRQDFGLAAVLNMISSSAVLAEDQSPFAERTSWLLSGMGSILASFRSNIHSPRFKIK